jgi:hypothetical protein
MINFGGVPVGSVLPVIFDSFAGSTGASVTLTGLAVTDIEVYKGVSMTQRASDAGYTLLDTDGIDLDGTTGIHGFSIDTGDDTDAGFYAVGSFFTVVVSAVTIDSQTVNFVAATFRLMAAEAVAGKPKVDVDAWLGTAAATPTVAGVPEVDLTHVAGATTNVSALATNVDAILTDTANMQPKLGSPAGADISTDIAAIKSDTAAILTDTGTTLDTKLNDIQGATFSSATDSLEAIRDRGDAAWITGAGGSDRLLMVDTTIATLATQTSFTLTAGSADDDAYNNCTIVFEDVSTSTQKAVGMVLDYTGATKTVTLKEAPIFTIATTDKVYILAENALKSTVANRQLDVTATGAAGIDWGNVENPTTAVDLSGTDIQLVDTVTTYTGNTAQTGDAFARLGAPAGASVSADVAAVKSDTAAILVDTTEIGAAGAGLTEAGGTGDHLTALATATNLATVDTVVDAVKLVTDALPDSGALTSLATAAALAVVDTVVDAVKVVTDALGSAAAANLALSAAGIIGGIAQAGTLSTTVMTTDLTGYADDELIGRVVIWTGGTAAGQASEIEDYASASGTVTYTAITTAPDASDTFVIV